MILDGGTMTSSFLGPEFLDVLEAFKLPVNTEDGSHRSKRKFLKSIEEESCFVIGIFGKTPYLSRGSSNTNSKEGILNQLLQKNIFTMRFNHLGSRGVIRGYHDVHSKKIYLSLEDLFLDSDMLIRTCREAEDALKEKGFHKFLSNRSFDDCKLVLFLFHVCHLVILYHPNHTIDLSYIQFFKTLDSMRSKLQPSLSDAVKHIKNLDRDWLMYGRQIPPRILFYFATCPTDLRGDKGLADRIKRDGKVSKHSQIRKFEFSLEDQIFQILRKARIVTSSLNCLFNIPPRDGFVYVENTQNQANGTINKLNHFLNSLEKSSEWDFNNSQQMLLPQFVQQNLQASREIGRNRNFSRFVESHIDSIIQRGTTDREAREGNLQLPTFGKWHEFAAALMTLLGPDGLVSHSHEVFNQEYKDEGSPHRIMDPIQRASSILNDFCDVESRFSELRCQKAVPLAMQVYKEGLQPHYVEEHHNAKLLKAMSNYSQSARGSASGKYGQILADQCTEYWKSGRQMCEDFSFTGNRCNNRKHEVSKFGMDFMTLQEEKNEGKKKSNERNLPTLPHNSGVVFISTCNCGRRQFDREDPFDAYSANYKFYSEMEDECCKDLDRIEVPTHRFRNRKLDSVLSGAFSGIRESALNNPDSISEVFEGLHISADIADNLPSLVDMANRDICRQTSSHEPLRHMLTLGTPVGRLPAFSSWALVQIGSAYLYSHSSGITHPGFMNGSRTLLPWDIPLKAVPKETNDKIGDRGSPLNDIYKRTASIFGENTHAYAKVFLGIEYECPRGHRFLSSSPGKPMKSLTSSSSILKNAALKLLKEDIPLYLACPCRNQRSLGQLMRIHVVTPKTPITITLNPMVQPKRKGPIFHAGWPEPQALGANAWWVLRLPFIYEDEDGASMSPKSTTDDNGMLLKGFLDYFENSYGNK